MTGNADGKAENANNDCGFVEQEGWTSGSDVPDDGEDVQWCFGIGEEKPMSKVEQQIVAGVQRTNPWLISLDSGSDNHCCMVDFGSGKLTA